MKDDICPCGITTSFNFQTIKQVLLMEVHHQEPHAMTFARILPKGIFF
jgi:hypothetical protein